MKKSDFMAKLKNLKKSQMVGIGIVGVIILIVLIVTLYSCSKQPTSGTGDDLSSEVTLQAINQDESSSSNKTGNSSRDESSKPTNSTVKDDSSSANVAVIEETSEQVDQDSRTNEQDSDTGSNSSNNSNNSKTTGTSTSPSSETSSGSSSKPSSGTSSGSSSKPSSGTSSGSSTSGNNSKPTTPVHTHSYKSTVTAATCTTGGYTTYTCSCGDSYKSNQTAALGHSFGDWYTVTEATTSSGGLERRTCSRCGATEDRATDPLPATEYYLTSADIEEVRSRLIAMGQSYGLTYYSNSQGETWDSPNQIWDLTQGREGIMNEMVDYMPAYFKALIRDDCWGFGIGIKGPGETISGAYYEVYVYWEG